MYFCSCMFYNMNCIFVKVNCMFVMVSNNDFIIIVSYMNFNYFIIFMNSYCINIILVRL